MSEQKLLQAKQLLEKKKEKNLKIGHRAYRPKEQQENISQLGDKLMVNKIPINVTLYNYMFQVYTSERMQKANMKE